ncbi:MAG: MGMT family protein [Chloroflexi bacterium]|nr:MAG: MGMT family protein [Chloroflexota bacterium]
MRGAGPARGALKPRPSFQDAVTAVIRDLRRGEVLTYGEVARRAGYPRAARAVGNVLATRLGLPWWRVVRANGELAAHSRDEQARRLRREGVTVRDGRWRSRADSKKPTSNRLP